MAELSGNTLRIVLVGKTGSGKSATASTILGKQIYEPIIDNQILDRHCHKASRKWNGRDLLIVDTPGLFYAKENSETTRKEICWCFGYSSPGPHALILVLRLGCVNDEYQETFDLIKDIFGEGAKKHLIVLFTRKDNLDNKNLNEFLAEADGNLKSIIKECGNRCMAINNTADTVEKEAQVQKLVELIDEMVQKNEGAYFSDPFHKFIEAQMRRQLEVLMKTYTDQREKELQILKEEFSQKYIKLMQEKTEKLKSNKRKYDENVRNIRREAETNIFAHIARSIGYVLSKVWHLFQKK